MYSITSYHIVLKKDGWMYIINIQYAYASGSTFRLIVIMYAPLAILGGRGRYSEYALIFH